jgi:hypothetical protein
MTRLTPFCIATFALLTLAGCQTSGVGDPCVPQAIPSGGFQERDIVIETTSVMCRTRVCLVYKFTGDPTHDFTSEDENTCEPLADSGVSEDAGPLERDPLCRTRDYIRDHVFCTCRCDSDDPNVPTCDCPGGFACVALQQGGGASVEGSYCVRDSLVPMTP